MMVQKIHCFYICSLVFVSLQAYLVTEWDRRLQRQASLSAGSISDAPPRINASTEAPTYNHQLSQNKEITGLVGNRASQHPHDPLLGARHANGSLGLIVDPSPDRLLSPSASNQTDCSVGIEGYGGRQVLEKVRQGVIAAGGNNITSPPRILCMVYTYDQAHDNVRAIADTWGRRCDGFFAASNKTDDSIGAIDLLHHGPEQYGNMWQKIRSMWAYAYVHYRKDYDYFYICGDDTYIVVDNLRQYLMGEQVQKLLNGHLDVFTKLNSYATQWKRKRPRPLLVGLPMNFRKMVFPAGGCGYGLNRAALTLLGEKVLQEFRPTDMDSREDVFIGSGLWAHGVTTSDTRDETGAFRYGDTAEALYNFDGLKSPIGPKHMKEIYGVEMLKGMDGVSSETIAFHLKDRKSSTAIPELMHRYDALLQGHCDSH